MRYMIHAYPGRMWYVEGYLVPKLKELGIKAKDIVVWNDKDGKGNLRACMEAFAWCGAHPTKDGTWHLQDDGIPCKDFKEKTERITGDVVCGFLHRMLGEKVRRGGKPLIGCVTKPTNMWFSFQCIRIADALAGGCAEWVESEEAHELFRERYKTGTGDDSFFRAFMIRKHQDTDVVTVVPNLVEHIAELIGGSSITPDMGRFRAYRFDDNGEWAELEEWIRKTRGKAE